MRVEPCSRRQVLRCGLAVGGLGLLLACGIIPPQRSEPTKAPRIGYLLFAPTPEEADRQREAFLEGFQALGYLEGQNVVIEWRRGERQADLPGLAAELVGLQVDLIVAGSHSPAVAAKQATGTVPIVMASSGDADKVGLVASLSRPGGNITGLTVQAAALISKQPQLLKEAVPGISQVGVLWNPGNTLFATVMSDLAPVGQSLGLQFHSLEVRSADDIEPALARAAGVHADGLFVLPDNLFIAERTQLAELVAGRRLPALYASARQIVEAGGLMTYGVNVPDLHRRAATYVDKILKGANPAELPVEQPTTFDFVINLKTAQALGLTIPQSVLAQAIELIQ